MDRILHGKKANHFFQSSIVGSLYPRLNHKGRHRNGNASQFRQSVQLLSCVWLFANPWIAAHQASLSITNSQSLLKLMSTELVRPFSHLILCHPLLLLTPIPPSIRVFSNESTLCMRWPKMYRNISSRLWKLSWVVSVIKEIKIKAS